MKNKAGAGCSGLVFSIWLPQKGQYAEKIGEIHSLAQSRACSRATMTAMAVSKGSFSGS